MTSRVIRGAALLSLFVAAGCGSNEQTATSNSATGGPGKTAAAPRDPCSLVTAEEVAAVIKEKVLRAQPGNDRCTYETEDPMASSVTLEVKWSGAAEEMDAMRGANKLLGNIGTQMQGKEGAPGDVGNMLAGGGDSAGAGVGEDSLFDASNRLHARKGSVYIAINPPMLRSRLGSGNPLLSADERRKMAVAIAQKAVSRL